MFDITKNNIITINRGDTAEFDILPNIGTALNPTIYTLQENDKLYLGVMEANSPFEDGIIRKVFTRSDQNLNKTFTVTINSEETEYLKPGVYYWSVKLEQKKSSVTNVYTIIPRKKFIIIE